MEASGFRVITYPKKDAVFTIWSVADLHFLNRGCAKEHIYKDIRAIQDDEYALFFQVGDYCDWILPGHPHFDPLCFPVGFTMQNLAYYTAYVSSEIISMFSQVADKCLGFGMGNHEWNFMSRRNQYDVHSTICSRLNVPDIWYSSFCDIYFVHNPKARKVKIDLFPETLPEDYRAKMTVVLFHGAGAPATAGGKINRLKSLHDMVLADLVIMGHLHEQISKPFVRFKTDDRCSEIQHKTTMAMITGSYLRGYMSGMVSYGERRGYFPTTLGATRAKFEPNTLDTAVESKAQIGTRGNQR